MEYAQARMQARFGERPDAARWRELEAAGELTAYLEALRATPMRRWLPGLDAGAGLHEVDGRLREAFHAHVREVAAWMPQEWRPAVLWLLRLAEAGSRAAWVAEWRRRWPSASRRLQRIAAALLSHVEGFAGVGVRGAWNARAALEQELRRLFRRCALSPEAAFAYLALIALDLERLRAGLVRRILQRP